jgi:hypothetical protein
MNLALNDNKFLKRLQIAKDYKIKKCYQTKTIVQMWQKKNSKKLNSKFGDFKFLL